MRIKTLRILVFMLFAALLLANNSGRGLSAQAMIELSDAGVDKYLGEFTPASSVDVGLGWVEHTYDSDGGDGPICIAGTDFSIYTRLRNPSRLMIFLQGGGACWQDFYFCNPLAETQSPQANVDDAHGIWLDDPEIGGVSYDNPLEDWSVVYVPYCDGSVFTGDNAVADANYPFGPVRHHRGLRNLSAAMDLAKELVPHPSRVMVAGSSAGGVGATIFAPFLARYQYGNNTQLLVFNDAGPVAINVNETAAIQARANDWAFGQFFPASCDDCDVDGQTTAIIDWRLANDSTIREAFYSTDGDATDRFFLNVPTQEMYRELLLTEHGALHDAYPERYKAFIRSGDDSHTALQTPLFYLGEANGVPLNEWTADFLVPRPFWGQIIEDFQPLP